MSLLMQALKKAERKTGPPVLDAQDDQHAEQQQQVAQHLNHKLRKKVCQCAYIAINAFDQFPRRVLFVKAHIKLYKVPRQINAQRVRRAPANALA